MPKNRQNHDFPGEFVKNDRRKTEKPARNLINALALLGALFL